MESWRANGSPNDLTPLVADTLMERKQTPTAHEDGLEGEQAAREAVATLLCWMGQDPNRDGLRDTPRRVAAALREMTSGFHQEPARILSTTFQVNYHEAGELLYLPAGESPSVKGIEAASLLLSIQDAEPNGSEDAETIHARGVFLSVMQAAAWLISLALLLVVAAGNVFAGALVIGVALVIFGCLHYWLWGRWMSPPTAQPRTPSPSSHR